MGPTGDLVRVLQIHPTRRCNLRCLHCYSSSAPEERDELPVALLREAVTDANAEGYNVVGVSGGEPVLYAPLRQLLDHAHACGMTTTVTSNGMLLDGDRLRALRGAADLLAISLDGVPASHNRIRDADRAFERMAACLDGVRRSGIPFGFIFTLTQYNLHELDWVARFAVEQGARLLQVHPLEVAGRAAVRMADARPDEAEAAFAYLECTRIQQEFGDRLQVQLDVVDRDLLRSAPSRVFADECSAAPPVSLAQAVSPLIVEPDGTVVPLQHGFARRYVLGTLLERPLRALADEWRTNSHAPFRQLCRRVFDEIALPANLPFINWYELLARRAAEEDLNRGHHLSLFPV